MLESKGARLESEDRMPGSKAARPAFASALSRAVYFLSSLFLLCSCTQLDRPYFLRFWEYNRLASQKERLQRHPAAAERFARSALNYAEHLGNSDFRLAVSLNDLAQLLLEKEKNGQAQIYLQKALEVLKRSEHEERKALVLDIIAQERAGVLRSLGDIYFQKSDFEKALSCFVEARAVLSNWCQEGCVDLGNPLGFDYVKSCWGEAESELRLKKFEQAQKSFRSALSIADANNFAVADEIRQHYSAYLKSRTSSAARLQSGANTEPELSAANAELELSRVNAGKRWSDHMLVARHYLEEKNLPEAKKACIAALAAAEQLRFGDLQLAITYKCLAECSRKAGDQEGLISFDSKALDLLRQMSHPSCGLMDSLYSELRSSFGLLGRTAQEEEILKAQLNLRREHYPSRQTETLSALAVIEVISGHKDAARQYALLALNAMKTSPANNRSSAAACFNLSETLLSLAEFEKAEQASREAVKITRDILHLEDTRTTMAIYQLANLLAMQNKQTEARAAAAEAQSRTLAFNAKKHLATALALSDLMGKHSAEPDKSSSKRFAGWVLALAEAFPSKKQASAEQISSMRAMEKSIKEQLQLLK